jgi:hypothetical protein
MNTFDLIVAALATWQIVEIWHHSLLFADWRSITEMWDNKLGELLGCPWCLSVWVGFLCAGALHLTSVPLLGPCVTIVLYGFAASRLANLCNDLFKSYCRTPKASVDFGSVEAAPTEESE